MDRKIAIGLIAIISATLLIESLPFSLAATEPPALQWENTYGYLSGAMAIQTRDQGFAIVGTRADFVATYEPYTNFSATLIKTDGSGRLEWQQNYVTPTGGNPTLTQDDNGHYIIGSPNPPVDSSSGNSVFQTAVGGYIIAGTETWVYNFEHAGVTVTNGKFTVFYLLKTDSDGNVVWHKTYNPGNGGNYSFNLPSTQCFP